FANVSPGIQRHAKDPRLEVLHLGDFRLMPPAFDERLLQRIACVFQVADEVIQRAQKLRLILGESRLEQGPPARSARYTRLNGRLAGLLGHTHAWYWLDETRR